MSCDDTKIRSSKSPKDEPKPPPTEYSQYDVTSEERKAIEFRAARRQALRSYFQNEIFNPLNHGKGGHLFDPALQRYQAMKVSQYEYFKPNAKTGRYGLLLLVVPYVTFTYLVHRNRSSREEKYRRGEVAYKDRDFKFI